MLTSCWILGLCTITLCLQAFRWRSWYCCKTHSELFLNLFSPRSLKLNKTEFRNFTTDNKQLFFNKINTTEWNNLLFSHDVNKKNPSFLNKINILHNECFPLMTNLFLGSENKIHVISESYYKEYSNVLDKIIKSCKRSLLYPYLQTS